MNSPSFSRSGVSSNFYSTTRNTTTTILSTGSTRDCGAAQAAGILKRKSTSSSITDRDNGKRIRTQVPLAICSNSEAGSSGDRSAPGINSSQQLVKPFSRGYRGLLWNAQGLFAHKPSKQSSKQSFLKQSMSGKDFGLISESHSSNGKVKGSHAYFHRAGLRAWWSHGIDQNGNTDNRRAGVGVVVQKDFLKLFDPVSEDDWEVVAPGEVAILHLRGKFGCLDLVSMYLPTGNQCNRDTLPHLRSQIRERLAAATRSSFISSAYGTISSSR